MPTVVYIVGKGRSGTTLLDMLLGQVPGVASTGELFRLWDWGLIGGYTCGCGRAVPDCPYWTAVEKRVVAEVPWAAERRRAAEVIDRVLSWPYTPWVLARRATTSPPRHVDASPSRPSVSRTAHIDHVRALRRPSIRGCANMVDIDRFTDLMGTLYRAVAEEGEGVRAIVDSSKWPLHPGMLGMIAGVDPVAVHMVRDVRGVVHSYRRGKETGEAQPDMPRFGTLHSVASWTLRNLTAELGAVLAPRRTRIRYEDLVAEPGEVLRGLLGVALGGDAPSLDFLDGAHARLEPTHTVGGNPARFETGGIDLELDRRWRRDLPGGPRAVATVLTAPLLARYGYQVQSKAGR